MNELKKLMDSAKLEAFEKHSPAIGSVLWERAVQDRKWGEQNHPDVWWLAILTEEVVELRRAILEDHFGDKAKANIREEAVQCAAVALAMVECIDRREVAQEDGE